MYRVTFRDKGKDYVSNFNLFLHYICKQKGATILHNLNFTYLFDDLNYNLEDCFVNELKECSLYKNEKKSTLYYLLPSSTSNVEPLELNYLGTTYLIYIKEDEDSKYVNVRGCLYKYKQIIAEHSEEEKIIELSKEYASFDSKDCFNNNGILAYEIVDASYWESTRLNNVQTLDHIYINKKIKQSCLDRIELFLSQKEKYIKFGRPYKLNILLCGVPGSGKTSLIRALSIHLNKNLYICSLTKDHKDDDLKQLYRGIKNDCPIVALEDIDSFFEGRQSKANISFSVLINILDGINSGKDGLINIITANNADKLDPALLRQGRIDLILRFDTPERDEVYEAFMDIVEEPSTIEEKETVFKEWYKQIRGKGCCMAAIVDSLFRHSTTPMKSVDELIEQKEMFDDIYKKDLVQNMMI